MTGLAYPDISPVLFSLGSVDIRWYSLAYLFGIVAAWLLTRQNIKKYDLPISKNQLEDVVFYITLGIVIGGRAGYVLFYGKGMLWHNPLEIFAVWHGGMSFHGGVIGVIIAAYLVARKIHYPFISLTDLIALYAPIGLFLGRLANFANDELWGRVTDVSWAVRFPNGGYLPRHPSQLYEAVTEGLLLFVILNVLWQSRWVRQHTGFISGMFLFWYAVFRMSLEQFREPDPQIGFLFFHMTMGQLLSIPLALLGLWVLFRAARHTETDSHF